MASFVGYCLYACDIVPVIVFSFFPFILDYGFMDLRAFGIGLYLYIAL